jgi:hypothetical protein
MAVKKRLYKSRLEQAIEELDNSVYVVEVDGEKVNDGRNNNYPLNHIRNVLDEGVKDVRVRSTSSNTSKKNERTWVNKGALDDGYDFGDITKSILGTGQDLVENLHTGVIGIGEKAIDAGAYAIGGIGGALGADKFQSDMEEFIKKDLINEEAVAKKTSWFGNVFALPNLILNGDKTDENSFMGEKADSLAQSAGQLGATAGLQAVGVPWWLTTGVTSFGGATEEALNSGASYGEAGGYGLISTGAELLTEKLSGGISFGGKTLDDTLLKPLTNKITNKTLKTLVNLGIDATGEGTEEVLTEVISNVGKKLTYEDEKTWNELLTSEEAMDAYLEAYIGGAALGGGANVGNVASSIKTGRDYKTGYTQNEQSVIDKEVQNRIGEQKLTNKEISKIKEEVETDFKKGYISTDTIESTLGGDTYNQLKSIRDKKSSIESEIKELENKNFAELKVSEKERLDSLREELKQIDTNTLENQLQSEMGTKIESDDYLKQSYLEQSKKGQSFTYDKVKVKNDFEKAALESASRVMNDTRRSHEFVEPIVKMAKDKGTYYEFTNNEELAKTKYNVKGKTINGLTVVESDGKTKVLINVDSNKALNAVVGHETTHLLEGTQEYKELQKTIFEFAKQKGDYNARVEKLKSLYENIEGADINSELTADLVGDYLFEDTDFVNSLSTQKPTVFQRIKELIDDLVVRFKGTKEEKALRDLQKKFKEAYRQNGTQTDTKYSLESDSRDYAKEIAKSFKGKNEVSLNEIMEKANEYAFGELDTDYNYTQQDNTVDEEFSDNIIEKVKFELDKMGYHLDEDTDMFTKTEEVVADNQTLLERNAIAEQLKQKGATVDSDGNVTLYHITTPDNYNKIMSDKQFIPNQSPIGGGLTLGEIGDRSFFTYDKEWVETWRQSEDSVVMEVKVPAEYIRQGAQNDKEIYIEGALKQRNNGLWTTDQKPTSTFYDRLAVKRYLKNNPDIRYSLSDNITLSEEEIKEINDRYSDAKITEPLEELKYIADSTIETNPEYTWLDRVRASSKATALENGYDNERDYQLQSALNKKISQEQSRIERERKQQEELAKQQAKEEQLKKDIAEATPHKLAQYNIIQETNPAPEGSNYVWIRSPKDVKTWEEVINDEESFVWGDFTREDAKKALKKGTVRVYSSYAIKNGTFVSTSYEQALEYAGGEPSKVHSRVVALDSVAWINGDEGQYAKVYNTKYSISDNQGRELSKGQQEFFKDSKVRDENGNLLTVYHGGNGEYTVFDQKFFNTNEKSGDYVGEGFYFAKNKGTAYKYGTNIKEVYLNMTNPLIINTEQDAKTYRESFDGLYNPTEPEEIRIRDEMRKYSKTYDYHQLMKENPKTIREEVQKRGYDGLIDNLYGQYAVFNSNQIKNVDNLNPTDNDDINLSLSNQNDIAPRNPNLTYGEDVKLQVEEAIAPLQEEIKQLKESLQTTEEFKPLTEEDLPMFEAQNREAFNNIDESYAPIETEDNTPYQEITPTKSLFETRSYEEVGDRKVNAYQYDNPEVKPYFQEEAKNMLSDLENSIKGERLYNDDLYYESNGEQGFFGVSRHTTQDIAELLDGVDGKYKYTYAEIEKGLKAIINDEGSENNAVSKRIEFYLDQRLRNGYTDVLGYDIPANQEYIDTLTAKEMNDYYSSLPIDDSMIPIENVSDSELPIKKLDKTTPRTTEASEPKGINKAYQLTIDGKAEKIIDNSTYNQVAEVLTTEPKTESDRNKRKWAIFKANIFDKGIVFEDLSLKTKNRELIAKWDYTLTSNARGQHVIGNGHNGQSKSLDAIRQQVDNTGLTKEFYEYMYHKHNVDRMTLDKRFQVENKPVFGESVNAEMSQAIVNKYETQHPEFMDFAQDVYDYVNADKQQLVDSGVISQEIADLWGKMYPHYVPTRRTTDTGIDINVPLDTGKTGINAPIKKATGGSADILPLFDTMAMRTLQTYRATAKNNFGVELKNTLGTTLETNQTSVDEVIDNIDSQDGLLQEGVKGKNPTFTVFENGEKITFEITKDMYDALKPISESSMLSKTSKTLNTVGNIRRGLLTEYNPTFMFTNAIKDVQDVLINSQHAAKTYSKIPEALKQLTSKGYWYQEYVANGGEQNSYFDNETNTFKTENKGLEKVMNSFPLSTISKINNFIEMTPRLAEYIASREAGRSIEVSMLDAARVTTNFKAGGDVTKWANRNGATFLNASVQGAMQQVRNIREANANGFRGYVNLATKFAIASLPAVLLNNLVWEDDEEYEELSDYVKQNYYVVAKDDDGTFIRIPKGRTVAVIQEAFNQMENLVTGDDEADLKTFIDLAINNLAPNNPLDNNILSPIVQVANNEAWYGGDLVPTRLQDLPASEQYDESTDKFSRWIGKTFNVSPYKVNYLLDQYSGGLGDVLLPMITPEATNDAETFGEYLTAPFKSKFTTNSTMNNQNISDFYDTSEELITNAKKSNATDKDVLSNKYINSVKAEMNELYKEKREIQNSDLSKSEKYEQVLDIQSQINELAENALSEYNSVKTSSNYSTVGDREYYKKINSEGEVEWNKVDNDLADDLDSLGLTRAEKNTYFKAKDEISYIDKDSETKKSEIIDIIQGTGLEDNTKAYLYKKYYNTDTIDTIVKSGISVDAYFDYAKEEFVADKDRSGKTISGSRKKKVISYVNSLDLSIPEKAILIKSTNTFKFNEYNKQIVEYVGGLDISYDEKVSLLEELDMKVYADGTVKWE